MIEIKDELKDWLIDATDDIRIDEVKFKKEAQLKKIKGTANYHGYAFEYDVWKLFLSLGPNYISNPNKKAEYRLKDIPTAVMASKDHQNDLVAYFDKHIFIIECKSTETKNGKTFPELQNDAHDTFALLQIKNRRIKNLHQKDFIPIHSICTSGYKINEDEQSNCLNKRKVLIITEEIRDYISTVKEVSGSKEFSFNQLLGRFRSGKADYGKKHIRAFTSKSGYKKKHNVYTFSISPKEMIPISTVSHQAASKSYDSKEMINSHYQRLLTKKRIEQVSEFLEKSHQPFPNNILVNYRGKKRLQFKHDNENEPESHQEILGNLPGTLTIDACPGTFHVIDGQHRLFGYTGVKKKPGGIRDTHRVLVTAFENLNVEEEADVFLDVNTNAKPVKPGLVMEIEYSTEKVFKRNLATSIVFKLRRNEDSSLKNLILEAEGKGRPLSPKDLQSSLLECKTLLGSDIFNGYFWNTDGGKDWSDLEETSERIYQHLNTLLSRIKSENKNIWHPNKQHNSQDKNGVLQNIIVGGLFIAVDRITEDALNKKDRPYLNQITPYCDKNYYSLISEGLKKDDAKTINDKMLQVSYWFGSGKSGQKNVADSYIYRYLSQTGVRFANGFIEIHFDPEKSPEEMEQIRREEKVLGKRITKEARKKILVKYNRITKGKRYSNAIKRIAKYSYIKHDHLAGDPWSAIVMQDKELKKDLHRKKTLHEDEIEIGGPDIAKLSPWRKLEAPELFTILSNPNLINNAIPAGSPNERPTRRKVTKAYIWNNLTIFLDQPYPHNIEQPKDSSPLWKEGFEYINLFYKYRSLSDGKLTGGGLDEAHSDEISTLEYMKPQFHIFDNYETKFKKMSKRIADIFEEEEDLLEEIMNT
ncbi:DGQHR domain-containing protein [Gammaproteobacteria bacterium]|nr:DGQHR domain-containing protein [Gammaproteobacteria bacterium]